MTLSGMAALCSSVSCAATLRSLALCSAPMAGLCHRPSVNVGRKEAAVMGGRRRVRVEAAVLTREEALDMAQMEVVGGAGVTDYSSFAHASCR